MPVSSGGRKWGRRAALGEESRDWSGSEEAVVTQKTCPQYLAVRVPTHGRRWQEWAEGNEVKYNYRQITYSARPRTHLCVKCVFFFCKHQHREMRWGQPEQRTAKVSHSHSHMSGPSRGLMDRSNVSTSHASLVQDLLTAGQLLLVRSQSYDIIFIFCVICEVFFSSLL